MIHVGIILKEELMDEYNLSQNELARKIGVPAGRINEIINGKRKITADTDLRLCKVFGFQDGHFLKLQNVIELRETRLNIENELSQINKLELIA